MKPLLIVLILLMVGCASKRIELSDTVVKNNAKAYSYRDVSGNFEYAREVKLTKSKLATRVQVLAGGTGKEKLLEKTFAISQLGSIKSRKGRLLAIRPELSQHTVWLEGKKYFSQIKLNTRKRKLEVILESPEPKWQGQKEITIPRGRIFCFYSQLPECLVASGMLDSVSVSKRSQSFIIVWDSWPYHQEHFTGIGASAFARANVSIENKSRSELKFIVEVNGQIMNLHFSNDGSFTRMFWTTQGITIVPPDELQDTQEL